MWRKSDIHDGKSYHLSLDQLTNGHRKFTLHEVGADTPSPGAIFLTLVVPNDLLIRKDFEEISDTVAINDGTRFFVDAHGVWLKQEEMAALEGDASDDEVPWLNAPQTLHRNDSQMTQQLLKFAEEYQSAEW